MNHKIRGRKFSRTTKHRKALFVNLVKSLVDKGRIETTVAKAKDLRPIVEKIITKGRIISLHNTRLIASKLGGDFLTANKVNEIAKKYVGRNGGYTRIIKNGYRKGNAAPMSIIEFV